MNFLSALLKRKYVVTGTLGFFIMIGVAATTAPKGKFKNLKVLPETISDKELSSIMVNDFTDGLGVTCSFCHAKAENSEKLDYASDANPQKENARIMMRMVIGVNKKYFNMKHPFIGDSTLRISCVTCHNGQPYPGE